MADCCKDGNKCSVSIKGADLLDRMRKCRNHTLKKNLFYSLAVIGQVSHPYKAAQSTLVIIQRHKRKGNEFTSWFGKGVFGYYDGLFRKQNRHSTKSCRKICEIVREIDDLVYIR
jgi:hypothetical protein